MDKNKPKRIYTYFSDEDNEIYSYQVEKPNCAKKEPVYYVSSITIPKLKEEDKIDVNKLKELTGGDSIFIRDLTK